MNGPEGFGNKDHEDEYEYEYDLTETEAFYIDLDLTTANSGRKLPLKRKKPASQAANQGEEGSNPEETPEASAVAASVNTHGEDENVINNNEAVDNILHDGEGPSATLARTNDIQILDLHGQNPIISYQNLVYHCTWSDLIGTAMFFSKPEAEIDEESLLSTNDFRLIHTSRIKLVGQRARLAAKPGKKRRRQTEGDSQDVVLSNDVRDEDPPVMDGKSLGNIRTSNPKVNADMKRQASFLEKLMDVKRAKGETDNIRTVFTQKKRDNTKGSQARGIDVGAPLRRKESPSFANEIEDLNRKVVRGDATALMRLQDIYSSLEGEPTHHFFEQQIPIERHQNPNKNLATEITIAQRQVTDDP